jgi:hypothetical protein
MSSKDNDRLSQLGVSIEGRKYGKLDVSKTSPLVQSILSKMVRPKDQNPHSLTQRRQGIEPPDGGWLEGVSQHTANQINDSLNLYQLLPDTELAQQILVSSILSPKDMVNTELTYTVDERELEGEVSGALLQVVEEYFDKVYKIEPLLGEILTETLFTKGSYPLVVLPESSIDDLINRDTQISTEELNSIVDKNGYMRSMGFLGSPRKESETRKGRISLEHYNRSIDVGECPVNLSIKKFNTGLTVTDNIDILKIPAVHSKLRHNKVQTIFGNNNISLESVPDAEQFYKNRHYKLLPVVGVKTDDQTEKENVGHPLVMKMAPEAVIPVHTPGNPQDHVGYFILLDPNGYPLARTQETNYYSEFTSNLNQSRELVSHLVKASHRGMNGPQQDPVVNPEKVTQIYAELVEENLVQRLRNGVYGNTVEVARPLEVYRIMLARALANMNTQVLFVPCELMTYIAFDFNRYGVGKSLLEDNKILASIRAMLMFANTMAAVKNSVPHVGLNIQLDPQDPDPSSTVEFLVHEYAKNRQATYPLGASSPMDIVNFLQNAGIDLKVSGNPAYPETRVDVEDRQRSITEPNTELEENLKKNYLMSLGLSPETVDMSYNVEFATSIVTSNLLLTKRVMALQDKFCPLLTDFIRKYICYSQPLTKKLKEIIKANISDKDVNVDKLFNTFIRAFEVKLPRPDASKLENQMVAFNQYRDALEQVLEAYFNRDILDGTALGDQEEVVDSTIATIKAYYLRRWLRENNVMPELMDLVLFDEKQHPLIDLMEEHGTHVEAIGATLEGYMKNVARSREERHKRVEEAEKEEGIDMSGSGGSDTSDDTESDEGEDDDFSMDDDLGDEGDEDDLGDDTDDENEGEEEETEEEDDSATESSPSVSGGVVQPDEEK